MRVFKRLTFGLVVLSIPFHAFSEQRIQLINNQPFPVLLPVEVRDYALRPGSWFADQQPIQQDGSNLVLIADLAASSLKELMLHEGKIELPNPSLTVETSDSGIRILSAGRQLGELSWDILLEEIHKDTTASGPEAAHRDFNPGFVPLPFHFSKASPGAVFDMWRAESAKYGLKLSLALRCFHSGFLDINSTLTNENAEHTTNVYAAVVCRWEQHDPSSRSFCYDNHIASLGRNARSLFREGEARHLAIQRGVDWVRTTFAGGSSAAWLNDFAPSFTVEAAATAKSPARFTGANASLLGRELQSADSRLYSITEIARSSVRSFRDRLKENILPPRGESISFSSRLIFGDSKLDDRRADQSFIAWNSLIEQREIENGKQVSFGMPAVRFGTSYFPYSTLGENFDAQKLPGMDRESFWPLAADTVNEWRLFADDIRRDLRIAKAMGFQLIRLHHLELLAPIRHDIRQEYLDFIFGELRHLQLKALLDIYASPKQISELLTRYGDAVDGIEIENEILIWGIPLDRPREWKEMYAAVKKAAPDVRVHFTGYNNTGMFDRLSKLGVHFDRVCLHSYIDTLDAIPSARGYSLALSSYASKIGKPPLITEWNWRGLTRMTEEARAEIYPQIIEGAINTRGIPDFYQFQFNETLCPNPRLGRGNILRHYELLHLSRRPKPEALVLTDIIRKYSSETDALRQISIPHTVVDLSVQGKGRASINVRNESTKTLRLTLTAESGEDLFAELASNPKLTLRPGQGQTISLNLNTVPNRPGFYHAFVRFRGDQGLLRYAWVEARQTGIPAFRREPIPLDWSDPIYVLYGQDAPPLEVETAIAIAETLESASGHPIEALQANDLPADALGKVSLILIGTRESNKLLTKFASPSREETVREKKPLVITGADSQAVEVAGMNFILSYWKNAKDSAAARVSLVAKDLPKGGDATKLP